MKAQKIKAIIFDIGGVLTYGRMESIYRELSKTFGIEENKLKEFRDKHINKLMTGHMKVEEFLLELKKDFKIKGDVISQYIKIFRDIIPKNANEEVINLVKKLKGKYKLGVISNTMELHEKINRQYGMFLDFDDVVLSSDVGIAKPDKRIYDLALKRIGLKASQCIFIDDRKDNLKTPRNMGFKVIHFTDYKQLIKDLKKEGIQI